MLGSVLQVAENHLMRHRGTPLIEKFLEPDIMVDKVKTFLEIHQDYSDCFTLV